MIDLSKFKGQGICGECGMGVVYGDVDALVAENLKLRALVKAQEAYAFELNQLIGPLPITINRFRDETARIRVLEDAITAAEEALG